MMHDHLATDADARRFDGPQAPKHDSATQTIRNLMQLAIVGLLIGMLLFHNVKIPVTVAGLVVILLLWLVGRTSATPLLVAFQLVLYFRETARPDVLNDSGSVLFVVVVLGLLTFLSRDQSLYRLVSRRLPDLFWSLFGGRNDDEPTTSFESVHPPAASPDQPQSPARIRQAASLVICVLVAQFLLVRFGLRGGIERGSQPIPEVNGMVTASPILVVLIIAVVVGMSELAWKRLTMEQASMFIRSTQIKLMYSDLRMIVRRRMTDRRRRKQTATASPPEPPSNPLPVEPP
jgi:uncharacterized membrane protein YbjE (DUF340 family)